MGEIIFFYNNSINILNKNEESIMSISENTELKLFQKQNFIIFRNLNDSALFRCISPLYPNCKILNIVCSKIFFNHIFSFPSNIPISLMDKLIMFTLDLDKKRR